MAKRFTDTEKWKDPWFEELSLQAKLFFFYFVDNCDCAGVLNCSLKRFNKETGCRYKEADLRNDFAHKIHFLVSGRMWMPKFIEFQYGKLTEKNNAHKGVLKSLEYNKIEIRGLFGGSEGSYSGAQDTDTEKEKEEDKERKEGSLSHSDVFEAWESLGNQSRGWFLTPRQIEKFNKLIGLGYNKQVFFDAISALGKSEFYKNIEKKNMSLILSPEVLGLALQEEPPTDINTLLCELGLEAD